MKENGIIRKKKDKSEYKFLFHKTSDFGNYKDMSFKDLDELLKFIKNTGQVVIEYNKHHWNENVRNKWVIEDYDTWRE